MKIIKSLSLVGIMLTALASITYGQTHTLEDVGRTQLNNSGAIVDGSVIKGYFFFYFSEKVSRKTANYQIVILDENLKEKASEVITESKYTYLLEASYNGNVILFKFFNGKEKMVYYRTMDDNGVLSDREGREANKQEAYVYSNSMSKELRNTNIHSVTEDLFVDAYTFKNKRYTYAVEGINNKGVSQWTYIGPEDKGVNTGGFLAGSDEQILIAQAHSKGIMSRDYTFSIVSLDMNGEKIFEMSLENSRHTLLPLNAFINDKQEITLLGEYFDAKDKAMKSESKGIFVKKIDRNGDEISENLISWSKDIGSMVSAEQRKEVSKYSLYFHNIVMTSDGKIIAVGEQYRKQVSAAGNAMKVLAAAGGDRVTTDASSFEIKIGHMFIITMNADGELDKVDIIEKSPNRILLSQDYGLVNRHLLAHALKAEGVFDYQFTQSNEDNSLISIGYISQEKQKGKLYRRAVFNMVNFSGGEEEPVSDKINFETEANDMRIIAGKPGYVVIAEYFRKQKQITIRLEPINY